ncbi:MAG: ABC transporter ATP-binding protein [Candidatus Omnitrophica bacterium]|nr:ABC transporter ATP-binding protein [Candidatus Omnitrophota bacterium]
MWHNFRMPSKSRAEHEPLVVTKNLCRTYGRIRALQNLNLSLRRGEILGLLGPNGAGKTTAIHILLGLLAATSGEASVLGLSPFKERHQIAKRVNFSSAYVQLPSNLKVMENLTLYAKLYGVPNSPSKIQELLELFEITHLRNRITGSLSAGEKTRLGLIKCLLNDPLLLLLDEPTVSLDPEMADTVRKILKRIQRERNMGILYTSHNMPEVQEMCDRILFIHQGRTITEGLPGDILKAFESQTLEQVFIKIVRSGDLISP